MKRILALFWSDALLGKQPIEIVSSKAGIATFFDLMGRGWPMKKQPLFSFRHYPARWFHILAFLQDRKTFGYLLVQISSEPPSPDVASVRPLWEGNSISYNTELPKLLSRIGNGTK